MGNFDMVGGKASLAISSGGQLAADMPKDGDAETLALFAGLFALMQQTRSPDPSGGTSATANGQTVATPETAAPELAAMNLPAADRLMPEKQATAEAAMSIMTAPLADMAGNGGTPGEGGDQDHGAARLTRLLLAAGNLVDSPILPSADGQNTEMAPEINASAGMADVAGTGTTAASDVAGQPAAPSDLANIPSAAAILLTKAANLMEKIEVTPADAAGEVKHHRGGRYGADVSHLAELMSAIRSNLMPVDNDVWPDTTASSEVGRHAGDNFVLTAHADFVGPMPKIMVLEHGADRPAEPQIAAKSDQFIGPMPKLVAAAIPAIMVAAPDQLVGPMPKLTPVAMPAAAGQMPVNFSLAAPNPRFVGPMPLVTSVNSEQRPMRALQVTPAQATPAQATPVQATPAQATPAKATPAQATPAQAIPAQGTPSLPGQAATIPTAALEAVQDMSSGELPAEERDVVIRSRTMTTDLKMKTDWLAPADTDRTLTRKMAIDAAQTTRTAVTPADMERLIDNVTPPRSAGEGASTSASTPATVTGAQLAAGGSASSGGGNSHGGQSGGQQGTADGGDMPAARDTAGKMMVHRLNTDQRGWGGMLVRQLETGMQNGTQALRIILEPGNLGKLNVDFYFRERGAAIRMAAETDEAARLLSGSRHHLSQMLEGAGMRLASLQTVTSSTADAGADSQNGNHNHAQQDSSGKNGSGNQSFANKMRDASQDIDAKDTALDNGPVGTARPQGQETAVISILA